VLVVSVFMIFWRSRQNHACESAKSFGGSLMSVGSLDLGSASLQKARVWPLLGCWVPNATPSLLMPCRTLTWLWGFMMASRGNGTGCLPKRRMHESSVHLPMGENIPLNTCWDSHVPILGFPFFPRKWQGSFGQWSVSGRHRECDVVGHMVVVGVVCGSRVGSCRCLGDGCAMGGVVGDGQGCASAQGDHSGCRGHSWVCGVRLLGVHVHCGLGVKVGHSGAVRMGRVGGG